MAGVMESAPAAAGCFAGFAGACAATDPVATASSSPLKTAPRLPIVIITRNSFALEHQPREQVEGIVVRSVAPGAVVVVAGAVELCVHNILRREPGVEPRQEVELGDEAVRVRAAEAAAGHGTGGVSQRVR